MAKRHKSWKRLDKVIRVSRSPRDVYVRPATDVELDELEAQIRSRLPHSYREFLKRFGAGELQYRVRLHLITPERNERRETVADWTATLRDHFSKPTKWGSNHQWLASLIYFAFDVGGSNYVWDPAAITSKRPYECQFFYLPRLRESQPVKAGGSFTAFVEWVDADVRSWLEPEELTKLGPGVHFKPSYLRAKEVPLKRDVKQWLAWSNGTVLALAKSIRDTGETDGFPILADALEEAGCTNADLLDSCRSGNPEIDGRWVLEELLEE